MTSFIQLTSRADNVSARLPAMREVSDLFRRSRSFFFLNYSQGVKSLAIASFFSKRRFWRHDRSRLSRRP